VVSSPGSRGCRSKFSFGTEQPCHVTGVLRALLLWYRHAAGETAIFMTLDGAFGADKAARRKPHSLNQAFGRLG
jgi:hypothetical protein